jgi:thioester reductase-like protein
MSPKEEVVPSVTEFYKQKNVLLTGATGFIGKAILYKLIKSLGQDIGQVYLLMRSGSNKRTKIGSPVDRLKNEILNNKVRYTKRKKEKKVDIETCIL